MQTKFQSLIEVLVGTALGFIIAFCAQLWIMHHYAIQSTLQQDFFITLFFTGISILRGYAVRRLFNWIFHNRHENR
jgi:hypothetical protein